MAADKKQNVLMYKGKPLVRKDNMLYYGDPNEKHIIMLQVLESQKQGDLDVATKVAVMLALTDPTIRAKDRIIKRSEKAGLYPAMDLGSIWIERANSAK